MRWGVMLLALGLLAQGPVKITVNTQLVVETVSVTDKSGKPIEGLTAKDFVVTEDGVAQTVSFCEYQKMPRHPCRWRPRRLPRLRLQTGCRR